nr:uncharacterized protein LOC117278587 [Nicotiana tomentosiformis]
MLTKFVELVGVELTLQNLVRLFAPSFYRGTMLNLLHRGGKFLMVKTDDKASHQLWLNFFYVRTEDVVANVDVFPEAWNYTHKWSSQRSQALMPSFWRKTVALSASSLVATTAPSVPAPTLTIALQEHASIPSDASAPQHFSLVDEDADISLEYDGLMPRKRRTIYAGEESPIAVDLEEGDFTLRETTVVHVGESTGIDSECLHLEEMNINAPVRLAGETIE